MELIDVRRLTGPNFLLNRPGAAAEIVCDNRAETFEHLERLRTDTETLLGALGWQERIETRVYDGGATIALTAPIDALYAATSVIEAAWDMSRTRHDIDAHTARIRAEIAEEADPNLLRVQDMCAARGLRFLWDDDEVSIGLGRGRKLWAREDLPDAQTINWDEIANIPAALVTGTNGKSTTVRLAAAIGAAAQKIVASSSSDYVRVGETILDSGDYSGPGGARMALRDDRADMAILETARGGLMRRGLPITGIDAGLITNVAPDHLGEYGITDVESLADAKFMIASAIGPGGILVLNHDDPRLVARSQSFKGRIMWYGLGISEHDFSDAAFVKDGDMYLRRADRSQKLMAVKDVPLTMGGAASYNVSNALGAAALTSALGIEKAAIVKGLAGFTSTPENNPGRGNLMTVGGVNMLIDFAHNPDGVAALSQAVTAMPASRRAFLLGQAGDRSDQDIIDITRAVHSADPDLIVVKELDAVLRGRERGAVTKIINRELAALGMAEDQILQAENEMDAVKKALAWARPKDLLVLLIYVERQEVMTYLNALEADGWQCGDPLPN